MAIPYLDSTVPYIDDWIYTSLRRSGFTDEQIFGAPSVVDARQATKGGSLLGQGANPTDPRLARATQIIREAGQAVPFLNSQRLYVDDYIFQALLNAGVSPAVLRDMNVLSGSQRYNEYLRTGTLPSAPGQIAAASNDPRLKRVQEALAGQTGNIQADKESAKQRLTTMLRNMGLGSLVDEALALLAKGLADEQILLRLEDTKEFQTRFAGIIELRKRAAAGERGLDVMTPGEYIEYENGLRNLWERAGLPMSMLTKDRVTEYIAGSTSLMEVSDRINELWRQVSQMPIEIRQDYAELLGAKDANFALAAILLDPDTAMPVLEAGLRRAQVTGTGRRFGFTSYDAEQISNFGISPLGLSQQFQQANALRGLTVASGGTEMTEADLVHAQFGIGDADRVINQAIQSRVGRFTARGGGSAASQGGIAGGRRA